MEMTILTLFLFFFFLALLAYFFDRPSNAGAVKSSERKTSIFKSTNTAEKPHPLLIIFFAPFGLLYLLAIGLWKHWRRFVQAIVHALSLLIMKSWIFLSRLFGYITLERAQLVLQKLSKFCGLIISFLAKVLKTPALFLKHYLTLAARQLIAIGDRIQLFFWQVVWLYLKQSLWKCSDIFQMGIFKLLDGIELSIRFVHHCNMKLRPAYRRADANMYYFKELQYQSEQELWKLTRRFYFRLLKPALINTSRVIMEKSKFCLQQLQRVMEIFEGAFLKIFLFGKRIIKYARILIYRKELVDALLLAVDGLKSLGLLIWNAMTTSSLTIWQLLKQAYFLCGELLLLMASLAQRHVIPLLFNIYKIFGLLYKTLSRLILTLFCNLRYVIYPFVVATLMESVALVYPLFSHVEKAIYVFWKHFSRITTVGLRYFSTYSYAIMEASWVFTINLISFLFQFIWSALKVLFDCVQQVTPILIARFWEATAYVQHFGEILIKSFNLLIMQCAELGSLIWSGFVQVPVVMMWWAQLFGFVEEVKQRPERRSKPSSTMK